MKNLLLFLSGINIVLLSSCYYSDDDDDDSAAYLYASYDDGSNVTTGDQYAEIIENPFIDVSQEPVSTFSIDADGASYANARRFILQENYLPVKDAIRTEEFINYFDLDYDFVGNGHPISLNGEVSTCPWNTDHKLIRIGIQGKPLDEIPASNFVFLIDVSGSMSSEDKLELLKGGFKSFVDDMQDEDRIAIVTYASNDKVILNSTPGTEKTKIKNAIDQLGSGGGTAGAAGIVTAYEIAQQNFIQGGNNRIILGTDGDFNIGISNKDELIKLIEQKRETGVFLTAIGVGRGNLNDATIEQLANKGNGTYEYVDNIEQLRKVFLYEQSKFYTVAKDVKVQVEFNPSLVDSYRLIGYENRVLENQDFENDSTDAGEIGSDQNITALYEIVPAQGENLPTGQNSFVVDFRYKLPDGDVSTLVTLEVQDQNLSFDQSSPQMKFVTGVSAFALILRNSEYKGTATYDNALNWVKNANLADAHGFKSELQNMISKAKTLSQNQ